MWKQTCQTCLHESKRRKGFLKPFNDWSLSDRSQPSPSRGAGPLQVEVTNFIHSEPLQWLAQERILSAAASSLFVLQEHWKANAWQDFRFDTVPGWLPLPSGETPLVTRCFLRNGPQWRNDSLDKIWEYRNKPSGFGHESYCRIFGDESCPALPQISFFTFFYCCWGFLTGRYS